MSDFRDWLMRAFVAFVISIAFMLGMEGCSAGKIATDALHDEVVR